MPETKLIIDGHVHIYDCYDLDKFFDIAIKNMDDMYSSIYHHDNIFSKMLLFTEGKENDYFSRFKSNAIFNDKSEYKFENTEEDCSIILLKNNLPLCYVLAGRQIVTKENLEVLSIASNQRIEDGLPIEDVIKRIFDNQGIAVLAWGVGKWLFKRGKIIKDIIEKYHSPYLFIGDNSGRPYFWGMPKLFNIAHKYKIAILRGSDPLPFSEEIYRVGAFGFIIEGEFQSNKPAKSFFNLLMAANKKISNFGFQDSAIVFSKRQTKMLFKKYLGQS